MKSSHPSCSDQSCRCSWLSLPFLQSAVFLHLGNTGSQLPTTMPQLFDEPPDTFDNSSSVSSVLLSLGGTSVGGASAGFLFGSILSVLTVVAPWIKMDCRISITAYARYHSAGPAYMTFFTLL